MSLEKSFNMYFILFIFLFWVLLLSRDYLAMLVPEAMEDEAEKPKLPSNVLSMNNLKTMNLSDQVKALLINGVYLCAYSCLLLFIKYSC